MKADEVGAGLGERLRQRVDRLDHQVDVDRHLACRRRATACLRIASQTIGPNVRFGT